MEGRRVVKRRRQRRNPLYVLFMSLLAAAVVLLITVIVLGIKLKGARADLAEAQEKIEQLQSGSAQSGQSGLADGVQDGALTGDDDQQGDVPQVGEDDQQGSDTQQSGASASAGSQIDWLDLSGHSEVQVSPKSVYDKYYTYYTTNGVNLRAGPGTSYDRVKLVDLGTEVKAAAKQDGWTFVAAGDKFGWINSDYLSTTRPEPQKTTATTNSSAGTSTSGTSASGTSAAAGSTTGSSAGSSTSSGGEEMPDWLKTN